MCPPNTPEPYTQFEMMFQTDAADAQRNRVLSEHHGASLVTYYAGWTAGWRHAALIYRPQAGAVRL